ncbi:MAG: hybrid sensor histidine kinase/response regulator [Rhizonema sp. PD38]|nr:hybrid sensor histidine kinase/response regulator [Rhizonema sp. PD38]
MDPTIREQSYHYFLQEAPELLQALEQGLLSLQEDYSINKVYNLMRNAHTLKGAAATVGLETIKTVTHSLEDIFRAICKPDFSIDSEVEALIFEIYQSLHLCITSALANEKVNDAEILDRTAAIFTQLQERLGDCFGQDAYIPNSVELGFDVTQSIFELGVTQRLKDLAAALATANQAMIATTLLQSAEVFLGLGESLNLPGFGAIASAAITALDTHPEQAVTIARQALMDFQNGQKAVLNGDRSLGGEPSLLLKQLSQLVFASDNTDKNFPQYTSVAAEDLAIQSLSDSALHSFIESQNSDASLLSELESLELGWSESEQEESTNPLFETIWGQLEDKREQDQEDTITQELEFGNILEDQSFASNQNLEFEDVLENQSVESDSEEEEVIPPLPIPEAINSTDLSEKNQTSWFQNVRVEVKHLDYLNYSIGELLTNQNRQSLQNEQLQATVRVMLAQIEQHQQQLSQLRDLSNHFIPKPQQINNFGLGLDTESPEFPKTTALPSNSKSEIRHGKFATEGFPPSNFEQNPKHTNSFDPLELNRYDEFQILIQSVQEDIVQLTETADEIEFFARSSGETLEKQRRLLTSTYETLMEARMLPLGNIFGRFRHLLRHLELLHNKQVNLELHGTEVLVDKVVAEKLFDPLLHLIRNGFHHGIESPTIRQQWGKSQRGQIEICAYHQNRYLIVEVRDDGQGLDFDKIRATAVERQISTEEQVSSLDEVQLTNLLFEPGFSTTSQVNDLSGRGIGLDVVRTQLQALGGSVSVYSERYQGTTFTLQIPLNLTIANLLLCQAGDRTYALFTNEIEQILIPQAHQIRAWEGGKVLQLGKGADQRLVPIYQLSKILKYFWLPNPILSQPPQHSGEQPIMPVIMIHYQDRLIGLEIDQLIGEQELTIRPLGQMIIPPSYIYGGSILADGRLTLVLNIVALIQHVEEQQINRRHDLTRLSPTSSVEGTFTTVSSTRFRFSLSQQQQLPIQTRAFLIPSSEPNLPAQQNKIILVVDDSITLRQSLVITLQKAGYLVLQAKDGYEALKQLEQHKGINLVICDIEMPRMNGFEFLKYRQKDNMLARIPVVILSSRSGEKHRQIATDCGATAYMTKPYLEHNLLTVVKDLLVENSPG